MKILRNFGKISLIALSSMLIFESCKKDDNMQSNANNPSTESKKQFRVNMTDAPGDYESLDVEITSVDAYLEGSGWVNLSNQSQVVSVLELTNGAQTTIASSTSADLEFGTYSMIRVRFGDENQLKLNSTLLLGDLVNVLVDLDFQTNTSNEVIIEIDEEFSSETDAELLLDFDVASSIIENSGQYTLDPVITAVADFQTGIKGHVEGAANAAIMITDGTNEYSTYINANGDFMIRGMADGQYSLTAVAEAETEAEIDNPNSQTMSGVLVVDGEIRSVGTINL